MALPRLDRQQARRIALRAALLDRAAPARRSPGDLVDMVDALAALRVELTPTVCPAAAHIAWTRLGDDYRPPETDAALADGILFERGWLLHPMGDLPLFLAGMRTWAERAGVTRWLDDNASFVERVLARIADAGPSLPARSPTSPSCPGRRPGGRMIATSLSCSNAST